MCEQTLKRFLHDITKQMRESSQEPNASAIANAFSNIPKGK